MSSVHSSTLQVPQAVNSPPIKPRNEQWDRAFEECKRRVKREDWELISKVDSKEELVDFVSGLERRYQSRKSTRFLLRCRKIIECLSPFMVAVDVFVQVNPAIGSIVWGGIRVILQVGSQP
jgi:hypothetical protein